MDNKDWGKYAPYALVIFAFFVQYNLFATPKELEETHRNILTEVSEKYIRKEQYISEMTDLKKQLNDMQHKIDKMYDIMTTRR